MKFLFTYFLLSLDVVEEFSFLGILEHDEDVTRGVNKLKMLDDVRMIESPEHFDLSFNFLKDALTLYLTLVENFNCYFVICHLVDGHCA